LESVSGGGMSLPGLVLDIHIYIEWRLRIALGGVT
jgi:hypothetical protein